MNEMHQCKRIHPHCQLRLTRDIWPDVNWHWSVTMPDGHLYDNSRGKMSFDQALADMQTRGVTALDAADIVWRNSHAPLPSQWRMVDGRMSDELRDFIEGMSVSIDVSTSDASAGRRYFGTVTEVMDDRNDRHGVTLLVQDAEPNFKAENPVSSAAIEALRDVDHVVTQWRESGRDPAYAQWLTLQDVVRAALAAAPSPGESA